ncbi:hypothetical protein [Kochikohdavirus PBEF19]|uniref:Uncharacterized protein n=1 Tax=Enterococcus phage PBEF129 TaxID=2696337 RepID=A0A7T3JE43_9CAUD|nr:hypothetical protein [Enterococcus phage PBEF129]
MFSSMNWTCSSKVLEADVTSIAHLGTSRLISHSRYPERKASCTSFEPFLIHLGTSLSFATPNLIPNRSYSSVVLAVPLTMKLFFESLFGSTLTRKPLSLKNALIDSSTSGWLFVKVTCCGCPQYPSATSKPKL